MVLLTNIINCFSILYFPSLINVLHYDIEWYNNETWLISNFIETSISEKRKE